MDYDDHPASVSALRRVVSLEAKLLLGRYHGYDLQFALSDVLGEWAPARMIRVGTDIYLLSGEVIRGSVDRVIVEATGLWMGTDTGSGFQPGVQILGNTLGTQGGRLDIVSQSGTPIFA